MQQLVNNMTTGLPVLVAFGSGLLFLVIWMIGVTIICDIADMIGGLWNKIVN